MLRKLAFATLIGACLLLSLFDVWKWYRLSIFKLSQMEKCTRAGYLEASKSFDPEDLDVELTGRTFLITGASDGVANHAAMAIAEKGGTVHLIRQNNDLAGEARDEIDAITRNENIHMHVLDMSNIASIYRFVRDFRLREEKLDVLVNNAAYKTQERTQTSEGLEKSFATNIVGMHVLTIGLLPMITRSEDPRVITVGSYCLLTEELVVDDIENLETAFSGDRAFCQQKRYQAVWTEELAKVYPRVQFSVMDPGILKETELGNLQPDATDTSSALRTSAQGADTIAWLAAADVALMYDNGLFYRDRQPIETHLPFGFTKETNADRQKLMDVISKISEQFKPKK